MENAMKYEALIKEWLKEKEKYVKNSTYALYEYNTYRYLIPLLGEIVIYDFKEDDLQNAVLTWMSEPSDLSLGTVKNLVVLVKQTLSYAERKGYRKASSLQIQYPKNHSTQYECNDEVDMNKPMGKQTEETSKKIFTVREQQKILAYVYAHPSLRNIGIALCLTAGLRIGEICSLQWRDINLQAKNITINKTIQRVYNIEGTPKTSLLIATPKSFSSVRTIPIARNICDAINRLDSNYLRTNIDNYDFFLTNSSKLIEPRTYRRYYERFLSEVEIPYRKFHALRHTFATTCVATGGDYKCISAILGHSSIKITLDMYVHPAMDEKRQTVENVLQQLKN